MAAHFDSIFVRLFSFTLLALLYANQRQISPHDWVVVVQVVGFSQRILCIFKFSQL